MWYNTQCRRRRCEYYKAIITLAVQAILPVPTVYAFLSSVVCLSVVCHIRALLKPFDGFRWQLAGTLVGSNDTLC